ncbi:hypothetical protein HPP92_004006 [Vanilla planifolia]|uniref:Uncharacterized protein n=1 Tax=Vanilla planifolia TaxID=51239 RepID=A0A835VKG4_VANPL|nr:hypothetical protein HPP92_004006 [Vanilla planifolia]
MVGIGLQGPVLHPRPLLHPRLPISPRPSRVRPSRSFSPKLWRGLPRSVRRPVPPFLGIRRRSALPVALRDLPFIRSRSSRRRPLFIPLVAGIYLSRVVTSSSSVSSVSVPSLAGFEAVLLALYGSEVKARAGKPLLISVPDLSQPSLYHTPTKATALAQSSVVGVLSPPLEPQVAVKSTKRACIVGIALDCYYRKISLIPPCSKMDFCEFVASWAGQDCTCRYEFDEEANFSSSLPTRSFDENGGDAGNAKEEMGRLAIYDAVDGKCNWHEKNVSISRRGARIPLPWELLQPVLRILGHCLLAPLIPQEVTDAASDAVRCVYARASHDITPQVILAARSLIQLDKSSRKSAKDALKFPTPGPSSNTSTPNKPRRPEVLLVSK